MPPKPSVKIIADAKPGDGFILRGNNRKLLSAKEHELILAGPSDTGKSIVCCIKLHLLASLYPGAQLAMVRNVQADIAGSIALTFAKVVNGTKGAPTVLGGSNVTGFMYENGSRIWCAGLDKPGKVLSAERDAIYVCQAEQVTLDAWEFLSRTCSGRGAIIKTPQLFADANPGGSRHWIRLRAAEGKTRLLTSRHEDNPTLYDEDGGMLTDAMCQVMDLPLASKRMQALMNLSGVRRKRLYEGIWATSEGAVYDIFDAEIHVKVRARGEMKRFFLAIDEGFTNPAVILDIGEDSDGRQHCFREFYKRGVLPETHCAVAGQWWKEYPYEFAAVDEAAAGMIASLMDAGVTAIGGKGRVLDGIAKIQNRLKVQADGKPRYTIDPACVEHINEFESYVWKPEKDVPVKDNDHSLDAYRYLHDVLNEPNTAFTEESFKNTTQGQNARTWSSVTSGSWKR